MIVLSQNIGIEDKLIASASMSPAPLWCFVGNAIRGEFRGFVAKSLLLIFVATLLGACASIDKPAIATDPGDLTLAMGEKILGGETTPYCNIEIANNGEGTVLRSSSEAVDSSEIKILNWNLYKGKKSDWQNDLNDFSKIADLLLIQEALLSHELYNALHHSMSWDATRGFVNDSLVTGVLTASSVESVKRCAFRHTEPIIRTPKTALITEYPLENSNKNLLVANIHAINFTWGVAQFQNQLLGVMSTLVNHDGPVILAGDFNTWRERRMKIVYQLAHEIGLQEVILEEDYRKQAFGNSLDFIFYKGLVCNEAEVIQVSSSDHNPIRAIFEVVEH